MRKAVIIAMVLSAILGLFVSCNNNAAEKFGTLEINIDTSASRGLEPLPMETKAYNVRVTDAGGEIERGHLVGAFEARAQCGLPRLARDEKRRAR